MPPKEGTKYKPWPRLERLGKSYYAYYTDAAGKKQRKSLKERNELRAQAKFTKLLQDVDRGVLGFSRTPQVLPFDEMVDAILRRVQRTWRLRASEDISRFSRTSSSRISRRLPSKLLARVRS